MGNSDNTLLVRCKMFRSQQPCSIVRLRTTMDFPLAGWPVALIACGNPGC